MVCNFLEFASISVWFLAFGYDSLVALESLGTRNVSGFDDKFKEEQFISSI